MKEQEQICHRCKHKWIYTGKKLKEEVSYSQFIQCPKCLTSTKLIVIENKEIQGGIK